MDKSIYNFIEINMRGFNKKDNRETDIYEYYNNLVNLVSTDNRIGPDMVHEIIRKYTNKSINEYCESFILYEEKRRKNKEDRKKAKQSENTL